MHFQNNDVSVPEPEFVFQLFSLSKMGHIITELFTHFKKVKEKKTSPEHHPLHRQISSSQPAPQAPFAHLNDCNQWMKSNQQSCLSGWQNA